MMETPENRELRTAGTFKAPSISMGSLDNLNIS
jgi:hypothetical protein